MAPDSTSHEEIKRFEEQYRSQPESLVFARLADAYRKAGEPFQALEVLEEGLARHPDYPSAHIVQARALRDLGRLDDAVRSFRRVLDLDAGNLVAVRELGSLAHERGELSEARHWYERLVQVDPTNEEAARLLEELPELSETADPGTGRQVAEPGSSPPEVDMEPAPGGSEWWNDPVDAGQAPPAGEPAEAGEPVGDVPDEPVVEEPGEPLAQDEVVAAILNGEVPREIRAEDTWWYEERPPEEPAEPSAEADLLTRTMADLYAEQGLLQEAAEIYEELLRDSPDDAGLRARLDELRGVVEQEIETVEEPPVMPASLPEQRRGPPVADELRRILRAGEQRAERLPAGEDGKSEADRSPTPARLSDFAREWLAGLEGGAE
jgi:tetratricopeptide (TPR) repeat protein